MPSSADHEPKIEVCSFSWQETATLLRQALDKRDMLIEPKGKSYAQINEAGNVSYRFVPPLIQAPASRPPRNYLENLPATVGSQLVLLIQAGAAAMGVWIEGELGPHKVITRYMTRKKRGKSQITYLKTKGKSRAGSRIRLRQTREFFIEINEKLESWREILADCNRLFYSCPVRTWAEVFAAKSKPPFLRDDRRLSKIPLDVRTPNFKELQHVFYVLSHGEEHFSTTTTNENFGSYR